MDVQEYLDKKLVHSVHTSERRAFRSCRRRWNWTYKNMLYPKTTPAPLEFGVAFHLALEYYYRPETWHDKETAAALAMVAFQDCCTTQYKHYKEYNPNPSWETIEDYKGRVDLGLGMLRYYFNEVSAKYDKDWTPIEVEVPFEVPLKDPDTGEQLWCQCDRCWKKWKTYRSDLTWGTDHQERDELRFRERMWIGLPVTYGGRLDALFQDNDGQYWVIDWKTTSRILDEGKESSFLQLDDQVSSYVWALDVLGLEVAGFVYVEFKKDFPKPPEELTRLYKGRKFSTSKTNLTTADMAMTVFANSDPQGWELGLYNEYIDWLKVEGPKFTQRHQIRKNKSEIVNTGKNLAYEVMDIVGAPRIYPQPGRFSCPSCLFQQPCLGTNMGEDVDYLLDNLFEHHDLHYYETRDLSTE